jgi:hypothetical protein
MKRQVGCAIPSEATSREAVRALLVLPEREEYHEPQISCIQNVEARVNQFCEECNFIHKVSFVFLRLCVYVYQCI